MAEDDDPAEHRAAGWDVMEVAIAIPGRDDIAHEAARAAAIALARMDSHVIECSARYQESRDTLAQMRESIIRLHERLDFAVTKREEMSMQTKRDSRNQFVMFVIAIGGWIVLFSLHFWKV